MPFSATASPRTGIGLLAVLASGGLVPAAGRLVLAAHGPFAATASHCLTEQDGGAEHGGRRGDERDEAGGRSAVDAGLVQHGVATCPW